ncbi:hypothetical protein MHTCC0001_06440 [Flavobacteriaceae bacterium MHTCC 0001]
MKIIKHGYGLYEKSTNGTIKLKEHNHHIGITPHSIIGFTYEIKSETTRQIKVRNEYVYSDGKIMTSEGTVETNTLFASILTLHTLGHDVLGKMTFRVSFPDNPELDILEQTFYVYDRNEGLLFNDKPFRPASDTDIFAFENKYKVSLCDDYKHFLKTYNGIILNWWHYSDEFHKETGAYRAESYGHVYTKYPFYDDLSELQKDWDWLYDLNYLFGLGNKNPHLDMNDFYMENLFYHDDLVTYAYPIGSDPGGNCMMQIAQGKYRGKLAMLDHEVYTPMVDWIEGKTEEVYQVPPEKATADGFLEDCFAYGGLTLFDISLDEFLTELFKKHQEVYRVLKDKYGKTK